MFIVSALIPLIQNRFSLTSWQTLAGNFFDDVTGVTDCSSFRSKDAPKFEEDFLLPNLFSFPDLLLLCRDLHGVDPASLANTLLPELLVPELLKSVCFDPQKSFKLVLLVRLLKKPPGLHDLLDGLERFLDLLFELLFFRSIPMAF